MLGDITRRWSGVTANYNDNRPVPPESLINALLRFSKMDKPDLVVDLGCGTGNSTRIWQEKAHRVIGIDPSHDMLSSAKAYNMHQNVEFVQANAHDTQLSDASADVVVASASIHWMEPNPTLKEIRRILKSGGIFSFWGPVSPPVSPFMELDKAFIDLMATIRTRQHLFDQAKQFKWAETVEAINQHNYFNFHRYFHIHQELIWSAEDYLNWLNTIGLLLALLRSDFTDLREAYQAYIAQVRDAFGSNTYDIIFTYTVHAFK